MFEIGTSITLRRGENDYASKIENLDSEYLYISTPIDKGRLIYFPTDSSVQGFILSKGAVYRFDEKVVAHLTEPVPMLKITRPQKLKKIQRRQFYRLEKKIPVAYTVLDDQGEEEVSEQKEAQALDISGGGLRLATEEVIPVSTFLELSFDLNIEEGEEEKNHHIDCVGKIVHARKVETEKVKIYHYGVKFISLPTDIQDTIIRFIFSEQRKMRRKGRLSHAKRE